MQTDNSALERSGRPGRCRHFWAHVGVGAGVGSADRAHQGAPVLIGPRAVSENQRALVGRVPARVAADGRAVRVEAVRRMGAAARESGAVRGALLPPVVPAEAVRLVGRVAGRQVGQGGQHARNSGGRDVDRRVGRSVDVIPGVV